MHLPICLTARPRQNAPRLLGRSKRSFSDHTPAAGVSLEHMHRKPHKGAAMRTELDVPFSHKDEAKALGAKWDRVKKIWYAVSYPHLRAHET